MFAVDTVLLAESKEELKWNVEKLHEAMKRHKLKVRVSRTQWSSVEFQQSAT